MAFAGTRDYALFSNKKTKMCILDKVTNKKPQKMGTQGGALAPPGRKEKIEKNPFLGLFGNQSPN